MDNFIDTSKFGVNAFRSKMTQKAGILKISHRGWLFGLFFEIIAAVIIVIIWKSKIEFSGFSILVYFGAFLFFLIGLLYALYVQEISFDSVSRTFYLKRGFRGFLKKTKSKFSKISSVIVRETKMSSNSDHSVGKSMLMWDIGIKCKTNQPLFDFWRACDEQTAMIIAIKLAEALSTTFKIIKAKE